MAAQTILVVPSTLIPAGSFQFGPVDVPIGVIGAALSVVTALQPDPFPAYTWALEGSLDGGVTWIGAGSASHPLPQNLAGRAIGMQVSGGDFLNASANPNRKLRGSTTLGDPSDPRPSFTLAMTLQALS